MALAAAANYGRANRPLLSEGARDAFATAAGSRDLKLLYDVSHNLAKFETHVVNGQPRLCVHRKGATLALPPGHDDLSGDLRGTGQPVRVPGSIGTTTTTRRGRTPPRAGGRRRARGEGISASEHAQANRPRYQDRARCSRA